MHEHQCGVSLIEVLVAVVVLSIGLLGLAGLQASGIRVGQSSMHRSQAAQLAYDMVDRIRVNVGRAGDYDDSASPSSTSIAWRDREDWRRRLLALPAGAGSVSVNGVQVTVTVSWDDRRGGGVLRGSTADDAARETLLASQFQITAQVAN